MRESRAAVAAIGISVGMLLGCAPAPSRVGGTADRAGLVLETRLSASTDALQVTAALRNERSETVLLVPDQCGRVTEALLARTVLQPEGRRWGGSIQAVKEYVLRDQEVSQRPDRFRPVRPEGNSCARPQSPVSLAAGEEIVEEWELPLDLVNAQALHAVGSAGSVVRVEAVEARGPDDDERLDFVVGADADELRRGRNLRVETPAAHLLEWAPDPAAIALSDAELFDRMMDDARLRQWIEAQPATSWRDADLWVELAEDPAPDDRPVELTLVTGQYERAAIAIASLEGRRVEVKLPAEADRTRTFVRRPATLPPGVALIPEDEAYTPTDDLLLGEVLLPSGRIAVGEFLSQDEVLDVTVEPGGYPVHATLGRYQDQDFERVAMASLVLSADSTVRWEQANIIPVDGGSTTITSAEVRDQLERQLEANDEAWFALHEEIFNSVMAHDYLATEWPVGDDLNLAQFSSGVGDGGYPVHVGFDAEGEPTRVVVDFALFHLAWPGS